MSAWSVDKLSFMTEKYFNSNSMVVAQKAFGKHFNITNKRDISSCRVIMKSVDTGVTIKRQAGSKRMIRTLQNIQTVRGNVEGSLSKSIRWQSQEVGLSYSCTQRILKHDLLLFPHNIPVTQTLEPNDSKKRVDFSRWFLEK